MPLRPDPKFVATRPGSGGGSQVFAPVSHQVPEFDLSEPSLGDEEDVATARTAVEPTQQVPLHAAPVPVKVQVAAAPVGPGPGKGPGPGPRNGQAERPAPPTEVIRHAGRAAARQGPTERRRGPLVVGLALCGLTLCGAPILYLLVQRRAETGLPVTRGVLPPGPAPRSVVVERVPAPEEALGPMPEPYLERAAPGARQQERPAQTNRPMRLARRHHGMGMGMGPGAGGQKGAALAHPGPVTRLTPEQLRGVMVRSQPQLHRCLQEGWGSDVTIGVTVRPTGQVERVEIMNALAGRPTGRCLEGRIRALRFPAFAEGGNKQFFWLYHMPAPGEG